MPLAPEKLRILTFPQRIEGDLLSVNALLVPTQRLLNVTAPFPSQLNPGTNIQLPNFIGVTPKLELRAVKGLSSYPFSTAPSSPPKASRCKLYPLRSRSRRLFRRSMKQWHHSSSSTPRWRLPRKEPARPAPTATAYESTCRILSGSL